MDHLSELYLVHSVLLGAISAHGRIPSANSLFYLLIVVFKNRLRYLIMFTKQTVLSKLINNFFSFFSYRSSLALHRRSSTEILLDHWATFCRGVPQCLFFVSGHSRIRTHVLGITMRSYYHCATLTPKDGRKIL